MGFGQSDVDSWSSIVAKLTARKVFTVGDLQTWTADEILSMLRALEKKGGLAKTPRAYLAMLASHLTIEFDETAGGIAASMGQGADWAAHCTKVRPSKGFNSSTYSPDQRLWAELPSLGSKNFLSSEDEHFLGDLLLLDAHAHPEKSYGEYLPPGMAARLAFLAEQLLPPLQPFNAGSNNPRPRKKKKMITNRWTNARNGGEFKRIVLDEAYRQHFTERIACRLQFVETGSDQLDPKTNRRNWYFGIALKIASGEIQVCCRPPPRVVCIECMPLVVPTPPASQVAPHSGLHLTCTCAFLFAQANPVQLPGETKGKVHDDLGDKENVGGQDTGGEADGGDSGEDDGEDDGEDSGGDSGAEEGDGVMEFVELDGAQDCDLALVITPALSCCIHISRYIQRVQFVTRQHDRNQCMSHDRNRAARPKPSSSTTETEIRLCKRTRQLAYSNFW